MASGVPLLVYGCTELEGWDEEAFGVERFMNGTDSERDLYRYAQSVRAPPAVKIEDGSSVESALPAYLKDYPCPPSWERQLHALQGPIQTLMPLSDSDMTTYLPEKARPETLMCYIGRQGTRTALHRDRCASEGQNLMAHTEGGGHSLWLLTETADADKVSRHFNSDDVVVEFEHHEASLDELAHADFTVYIGEQRTGDFIYVPSRSTHQVINRGGLTCKIAWSRMTARSLTLAMAEDLPIYNILRVPEIYRVKLLLHQVVLALTAQLTVTGTLASPIAARNAKTLEDLLPAYDQLISEEWLEDDDVQVTDNDDALLVCDSCGQDIFSVYWQCDGDGEDDDACKGTDGEKILLCSACYAIGRTCACRVMKPLALRNLAELVNARNAAAVVLAGDDRTERVRDIEGILALNHLAISHAAEQIYDKRREPAKQITCHYLNYHPIWAVEGHFCRRCSRRVCFRCFARIARVHAAEVLLMPFETDDLHRLHRDEMDVSERDARAVRLGEAVTRAHLARPPPPNTAGGWYDPDEDGESISAPAPPHPHPAPSRVRAPKRKRELRDEEKGDEELAWELSGLRTTRKRRSTEGKLTNGDRRAVPVPLTSRAGPSTRPRRSVTNHRREPERDGPSLEEIREQGIEILGWDLPEVPPHEEGGSAEREEYAEKLAGKLMQLFAEQHKAASRLSGW
ncbi:hypothetical protein EXIGLDRAFT_723339 [Exidia glandulosa HHB12029]|uniref:JmjC domain-containing protein n=1 Tax=Exidia glandulosa HHB12029 TaxID=1314781 RepID=A0A165EVV6_EXIGL|nr:hypothetical protein EXIGLDRAFT_723339 [Exidia glandulosa HHB12029]